MIGRLCMVCSHAYDAQSGIFKRTLGLFCALFLIGGQTHAQSTQVAILGDSIVAGYGLPLEAGLVPQLQTWMTENGHDITLVNAGVSGDTTAGGLARLDWTITAETRAIVISLGANDMLRGLPPELARTNLRAMLEKTQERGLATLLVGLEAPLNWGPAYKENFDTIFPNLAEEFSVALLPSLFGVLTDDGSAQGATPYLQGDGLHPNRKGVAKLVEALGPFIVGLLDAPETGSE